MNRRLNVLKIERYKLSKIVTELAQLGLHSAVNHLQLASKCIDSEIALWEIDGIDEVIETTIGED